MPVRDDQIRPAAAGPTGFEWYEAPVLPALQGIVSRVIGYRQTGAQPTRHQEAASLAIPLVVSFGEAFRIGLGREPAESDGYASFAAGLFAGPVIIETSGASSCLQIDFTPQGARRFFQLPMSHLAGCMVGLDDVFGRVGGAIGERLGNTADWPSRAQIAQDFVLSRTQRALPMPGQVEWALREMRRQHGTSRISNLAVSLGCSRKHLSELFSDEIGISPKAVARILRIRTAMHRARSGTYGWADVAADCGFVDQAHLVREFRDLAGETPSAWLRRIA